MPPVDLVWPGDPDNEFSLSVANALLQTGYCLVRCSEGSINPEPITELVKHEAGFTCLKREFEEAYLGSKDNSKVAWINASAGQDWGRGGHHIESMYLSLSQVARDTLGFTPDPNLGPILVRMPLANSAEKAMLDPALLSEADVQEGMVADFLDFVRYRRVCMIFLANGEGGRIELTPRHKDDGLRNEMVPVTRNDLLVFRHDLMKYRYRPGRTDIAVQGWLLEAQPALIVQDLDGNQQHLAKLTNTCGPLMPTSMPVHIMSAAIKGAGNGHGKEAFRAMLSALTDCAIDLCSCARFEFECYYSPNLNDGLSVSRHASMLDGRDVYNFDPNFFDMTAEQVELSVGGSMRMLIECATTALHDAKFTKKSMRAQEIMTSVADGVLVGDFNEYEITGRSYLNPASKIQYTLGLVGPAINVDTACSASLVAIVFSQSAMKASNDRNMVPYDNMRTSLRHAVTGGTQIYTDGTYWIGLSQARMIGWTGRSLTFDVSAGGYARGESAGALYLRFDDDEQAVANDRLVVLTGACTNQDGRSASMTAPNGPSQAACIKAALAESRLHFSEVSVTELHGTGTALGDPIEIGSTRSVHESRDMQGPPLHHGAGKSIFSHPESNAGTTHVCRLICQHMSNVAFSNCHLREMNPNADTARYCAVWQTEMCDMGLDTLVSGAQSFGIGGSNARVDLWSRTRTGLNAVDCNPVVVHMLDSVGVACPRCSLPMCWRCSEALPSNTNGKHQCSAIREQSTYDCCSNCFTGRYTIGAPPKVTARLTHSKVQVLGTWDAWSNPLPLELLPDGTLVCAVRLGDVNREQFRIIIDDDTSPTIHPLVACAGRHSPICGPDMNWQGKNWLIDGRADGAPSGSVYNIKVCLDPDDLRVWWEVAPPGQRASANMDFQHTYSITGSAVYGSSASMRQGVYDPHYWHYDILIGSSGSEEFLLLRDCDRAQTLYPAQVPGIVAGPDSMSNGSTWEVFGAVGEVINVNIRIVDRGITVIVKSEAGAERRWHNMVKRT